MQVNATLIAAQQAAREAQARFQAVHAAPASQPAAASFAATLGEFAPATEKPAAPTPAAAQVASPAPFARMGSLLDIKI